MVETVLPALNEPPCPSSHSAQTSGERSRTTLASDMPPMSTLAQMFQNPY